MCWLCHNISVEIKLLNIMYKSSEAEITSVEKLLSWFSVVHVTHLFVKYKIEVTGLLFHNKKSLSGHIKTEPKLGFLAYI